MAPAQVAKMEADVRALAVSLVDQVAEAGAADLYEMLGKPLPLLMITLLLGIERDEMFWEATDTLMYGRLSGVGESLSTALGVRSGAATLIPRLPSARGGFFRSIILSR